MEFLRPDAASCKGEKRLRVARNVIVFSARIGNRSWLLRLLPVVGSRWRGLARALTRCTNIPRIFHWFLFVKRRTVCLFGCFQEKYIHRTETRRRRNGKNRGGKFDAFQSRFRVKGTRLVFENTKEECTPVPGLEF